MATKQITEVWSDLDHRLVQDSLGNLKKVTNVAAVLSSIDNILRTYQGERVMLPQFASNLRGILFEPINSTALKLISKDIKETIEIWDNRVTVLEVSISPDPDNSAVSISLEFSIRGHGDIFQYQTTVKGE